MFDFKDKKVACFMTCNENEQYQLWIPSVVKMWNLMNIHPIIMLVGVDSVPDKYKDLDATFVLYNECNHISTIMVSQVIRNYYPQFLDSYDSVIISDIDMLPLPNKNYFEKWINESIEKNTFVGMRWKSNQYFMPFNAAPPSVWRELFPMESESEMKTTLERVYAKLNVADYQRGPTSMYLTDQSILKEAVHRNNNYIRVDEDLYMVTHPFRGNYKYNPKSELIKKGAFQCNQRGPITPITIDDINFVDFICYTNSGGGEIDELFINDIFELVESFKI